MIREEIEYEINKAYNAGMDHCDYCRQEAVDQLYELFEKEKKEARKIDLIEFDKCQHANMDRWQKQCKAQRLKDIEELVPWIEENSYWLGAGVKGWGGDRAIIIKSDYEPISGDRVFGEDIGYKTRAISPDELLSKLHQLKERKI